MLVPRSCRRRTLSRPLARDHDVAPLCRRGWAATLKVVSEGHSMAAVALPDWLDFRRQRFPSCNFVWLRGSKPVLADTGFGSDLETTLAGLADRFRMPD